MHGSMRVPPRWDGASFLLLLGSVGASSVTHYSPAPPPVPPGMLAQTARGEPPFIGIVCALFWAAVWALLYRATIPWIRAIPLSAKWGAIVLQRQKAALAEMGFHEGPNGMACAVTDDHAADMFAWLCITGVVYLVAGVMAIPMMWYGYDRIGSTGHLLFFTSTWLVLG